MRLINAETLKLEEFPDGETPIYAILSHTWGSDLEELTLRDVEEGEIDKPGIGSAKFRGCCQQAKKDGFGYIWIDTCCINKTDLVELSEAINSMFRWYKRAAVCYAYLSDVPGDENPRKDGSKFRTSRWFQRGWTLQELLAPRRLVFYSLEWRPLGTKVQLGAVIERVTGIHRLFLKGVNDLQSASVAQRMSWAAQRDTKRKEDLAYCLLGIFGITMPMIYGEGGDRAFFRLQEQILRSTRDHSILAWGLGGESTGDLAQSQARGFLAAAPSDFANSGHIVPRNRSTAYLDSLEISGGSLHVSLSLLATSAETVGLINCGPEGDAQQVVGIPLMKVASGGPDEYIRPRGCHSVIRPIINSDALRKPIHIRNDNGPDTQLSRQQGWIYDDSDFADAHLELVDVAPRSSWDEERAVIMSTTEPEGNAHPTLVRLRHYDGASRDFILILEFKQQGAHAEAHYCIAICSRITLLTDIVGNLQYITRQVSGKRRASNGLLNLQLILERNAGRPMFTIKPKAMRYPPYSTVDVTVELQKPHLTLEIEGMLHAQKRWDELQHIDYDEESGELESIYGQLPLLWASENGHTEMVKLLLDNGIDVAAANNGKRIPLIAAADKGHADVVRLLLATSGTDVNVKDSESGRTPLSWAVERGHETVVQLLLEKGASITVEDRDTCTALLYAAGMGHNIVELLLGNGAAMNNDDTAWRLRQTLKGHEDSVLSVAFSHDSKLLASGSSDDTVRLWDTATGQLRQTFEGHQNDVTSVAFSHDSKLLASGSDDNTVRVWDTATGQLRQTLEGHQNAVNSIAFSHDSKLLASGSDDNTVRIWDTATGQLQQTFGGQPYINSIAFSHDSKLLASGSNDKTVRLWDTVTGQLRQTLEGHEDVIYSVVFSHDSKLLASGSVDKTVRLWDTATDARGLHK
ncbi:hypothetical protein DL771_000957 [Monosporascus sp. 5C6A]|nr:hypothetical protein DL771_000957 [Monosporascus sp. 5C6A]